MTSTQRLFKLAANFLYNYPDKKRLHRIIFYWRWESANTRKRTMIDVLCGPSECLQIVIGKKK